MVLFFPQAHWPTKKPHLFSLCACEALQSCLPPRGPVSHAASKMILHLTQTEELRLVMSVYICVHWRRPGFMLKRHTDSWWNSKWTWCFIRLPSNETLKQWSETVQSICSLHIYRTGTSQANVAAHNRQAGVTHTHTHTCIFSNTYVLLIRNEVM